MSDTEKTKSKWVEDAEYDTVCETFPRWAEKIIFWAKKPLDEVTMSRLWGMADAMIMTGQYSNANRFVFETINRVEEGSV